MRRSRTAVWIAAAFFLGWLLILWAGADHPPPPGFIVVVLVDLACAVVVYLRVDAYIAWARVRRRRRLLLALRDGAAAGLVVALIVVLLPGGVEPSVQPGPIDAAIWFAILGTGGAANAVCVYALSAWATRRRALKT